MRLQVMVAALLVSMSVAAATPREDLAKANEAFRLGQFPAALEKYNALLYPHERLASRDDLAEAYVGLGVCRLETGDREGAKREFEKALSHDPNWQLDPLVVKNREAIRLFDDTKAELRTRAEREAERKKAAELIDAQRKYLDSLRVYEARPYYLTFVPFGFGQFNNGHYWKGILFAGGQLVTASTSIGIWLTLVGRYGIRSDRVPLTEAESVRRLQIIEIGTGAAFFGLYVWSMIDAHRNFKPAKAVKGDDSLLPPELRDPTSAPQKAPGQIPPKTSFWKRLQLAPMVTHDGVGIGIGWEN